MNRIRLKEVSLFIDVETIILLSAANESPAVGLLDGRNHLNVALVCIAVHSLLELYSKIVIY